MRFLKKIVRPNPERWKKRVFSVAKKSQNATELCQWVAKVIQKPIYPIESLDGGSLGSYINCGPYYLIFYQPSPPIVSELTILHELTHILFRRWSQDLSNAPEGSVERFAIELFSRVYDLSEIFSPVKNSEVVERYKALVSF